MTWARFDPSVIGRAALDDLSPEALLAHLSALGWLSAHERPDATIPRRLLPVALVMTDDVERAAKELDAAGWWSLRLDGSVQLLDHGDTLRQSLAAQDAQRVRDREKSRRYRARKKAEREGTASPGASPGDVTGGTNYLPTEHLEAEHGQTAVWPEVRKPGTGTRRERSTA